MLDFIKPDRTKLWDILGGSCLTLSASFSPGQLDEYEAQTRQHRQKHLRPSTCVTQLQGIIILFHDP